MIIDFSNKLNVTKVQEMISDALSGFTGVINLSTATADEVMSAFTAPDRWLCSINYSGETYLEHHRLMIGSGQSYDVYFYVIGAGGDTQRKRIYDRVLYASVDTSTGEVDAYESDYVPDIIYNLDLMNAAQLLVLRRRLSLTVSPTQPNKRRFTSNWTYNGRYYQQVAFTPSGSDPVLMGMDSDFYVDYVTIASDGTLQHDEYTTNITLTPLT